MKKNLIAVILLSLFSFTLFGQDFIITGKIFDSVTEEPLPFASVSLKGTTLGTNSDFEGNFILYLNTVYSDTLIFTSMGYEAERVTLKKDSLGQYSNPQIFEIHLKPGIIQLSEVVVYAGENPAWSILRKVVKNRDQNNFKKLDAYDHQSYNKVEVDVNQVSERMQQRRITQKINQAAEEVGKLTDEEGKKILPMFISESISHYYFNKNPRLSKEVIQKTNIKGIAVTDGSLTSQMIGSTFQQYNFYANQVNVLEKNFTSPIGNDWRAAYEYYLSDSILADNGDYYYEIEFEPKRKQDLVFTGLMWISREKNALIMIDATISKDANLNFIQRIKIQQELEQVDDIFFPVKNRVVVDVSEITNKSPGILLKFTNYNDLITLNKPKETSFFRTAIELSDDYNETSTDYWQSVRPEPFDAKERLAYVMIDSIKQVPVIKRVAGLLNIATTGYGKFLPGLEIGPLVHTAAINDLEGLSLRIGLRTNINFSKKWVLKGYTAFGTKDNRWKGGMDVTRIISKSPWTTLKVAYKKDIEQVGYRPEDLGLSTVFSAAVRFGTLIRPYFEDQTLIQFQSDIYKGITAKIDFQNRGFDPLYDFSFRINPELNDLSPTKSKFRTSTIGAEVTFARDQLTVISDNDRLDFGTIKSPTVTLSYRIGLKNIFESDFHYHQLALKYKHSLNWGYFGKTYYRAEVGKFFGTLPYPLLKNHLGNQSIIAVTTAFNLMNPSEFVSDQYAFARYYHDFEGLFFNRFPLIKRLKWRTFTTGKFLIGSLSSENLAIAQPVNETGFRQFSGLNPSIPYIELGYGISNIFRVFRVEAVHRINYLQQPDVRKFGVKVAAELTL